MSNIRQPAVAGQFYSSTAQALESEIRECYLNPRGPGALPRIREQPLDRPLGLILPHAGYRYSGPTAVLGMALLAEAGVPQAVVIVGPAHLGLGPAVALSPAQEWQTPLGRIPVQEELGRGIAEGCVVVRESEAAHREEHSVEVMVPFLQHLYGEGVPLVALVMGRQDAATALALGGALSEAARGRGIALIASTDLSHYYPQARAQELDSHAIDAMLTGEPEALLDAVERYNINMCGCGPAAAVLEACRRLGMGKPRLLGHATSGDATGDYSWVVGYAALAVE